MVRMTPREQAERWERLHLAPWAAHSRDSSGRVSSEAPCPVRTCYQRDVDRITHSKAFRRLANKTQVFFNPEGDHYRTRLTHVLEVSRIARTAARALHLNEDLVEAIAMGHDLGHAPFGHAGERTLNELAPGGFSHNEQGRRVVEVLESAGKGLNLSWEVRDGIAHHTGPIRPATLEGELVHISDRIAYVNHDMDDAIRAGLLREQDLPLELQRTLGSTSRERINTLVTDLIFHSLRTGRILMSRSVLRALLSLRRFMFARVYNHPAARGGEGKVAEMLGALYAHYRLHPDELPPDLRCMIGQAGLERVVIDYIAGMTDRFAEERARLAGDSPL